jgi:aryl-alcohol dehydrogenase-like predicted oxidoreductase
LTRGAYRAPETLLADGHVRTIGVSNFMPEHLDALMKEAAVVPAVNQVETHHLRPRDRMERNGPGGPLGPGALTRDFVPLANPGPRGGGDARRPGHLLR